MNDVVQIQSFRALLGYRARVWSAGYAEIVLTVEPQHLNNLGFAHGGLYATLLDSACGHAVAYCAVPGRTRRAVTTSLTTTFLAGAPRGTGLIAMARVIAQEGRVVSCQGEVRDAQGTVYALGQATFLYQPGSERPEGVPSATGAPQSPAPAP